MKIKNSTKTFWVLLLFMSCLEPYLPPSMSEGEKLLVVDGFLNTTNGSCTVVLSRTQDLTSMEAPLRETNAAIILEEEDGTAYTLTESENGTYNLSGLNTSLLKKYRLNIKTSTGEQYLSDLVESKETPPIDSVTWKATDTGIEIYVNAHDNQNLSKYYQWRYVETWIYTSPFPSDWVYKEDAIPFPAVLRDELFYKCWRTMPSTKISIGSSLKLSGDIISNFLLTAMPKYSEKYLYRYSILVEQNTLSEQAYNYWQELQKNTESLGTLFDPQPSQVLSNIRNVNNASEPVLGYFNVGMVTEKRIFIANIELPRGLNFIKPTDCKLDTVLMADLPNFNTFFELGTGVSPKFGPGLIGFTFASKNCMDCRTAGGTTIKPDFW